jgi:hypothetical protein
MSGTQQYEVPRMLYETDQIDELQAYIEGSQEPNLIKWWARYHESLGNYEEAQKQYESAGAFSVN